MMSTPFYKGYVCDLYENILELINELSQCFLQGVVTALWINFKCFEEIKHLIKSIRNNVTLSSIHLYISEHQPIEYHW